MYSVVVHDLFSSIIVSMSHIPVSICIISLGVVGGVWSILWSMLSSIFCICSTSPFVGIHVSAAYSMMGSMHVSTSFHMVLIST